MASDSVTAPTDEQRAGAEAWQDESEVGRPAAREAFAEAARPVLVDAARRYHSVVTYTELAEHVQQETGIRAEQQQHHWVADVLGRVARSCHEQDEPLLSALCVNAQGSVGQSYGASVRSLTGELPADPDQHAAQQRLECHRHFGAADLPAEGGVAALVPQLADSRARTAARLRKEAREARPVDTCPTCQMALPATGTCDDCG